MSGFTGAVADLDFRFDGTSCTAAEHAETVGLDHTFVGDLVVTLTSPQGKTAVLINRPALGSDSGNNFCNTLLDDEGNGRSIQDVVSADAPNTGTFTPATPLAAFAGENPNGTWILNVSDRAFVDVGNVRAFSLIISDAGCNVAPTDTTAPTCDLTAYYPGPPTSIDITVQDTGSGIASINIVEADNLNVNIPAFDLGTTAPLIVNAALLDQSMDGFIELEITDLAGNVTICDPVVTTVDRTTGQPTSKTFSGIPEGEHKVTVRNGDPGLTKLDIIVNGTRFRLAGLHPNEVRYMDVSTAMRQGNNNIIELVAFGNPGSRAVVLISD